MTSPTLYPNRRALTLIELLVVMAIIILFAAMAAMFMPGFEMTERSGAGAADVQQWFTIARQRAAMDRKQMGIRFFRDVRPNTNQQLPYMSRAQYIQQPDDFTGGTAQTANNTSLIRIDGVDVSGGFVSDRTLWPVQVGDSFQVHEGGLMHRITDIDRQSSVLAFLTLASAVPNEIKVGAKDYRIVRRPRPLGEDTLQMPFEVAIDLNIYAQYPTKISAPPFNSDGTLDIMFAPNGAVMGNFGADQLVFWIREKSDKDDMFFGDPSLIVLFTRSGMVESYEIPRPITQVTKNDPFVNIR